MTGAKGSVGAIESAKSGSAAPRVGNSGRTTNRRPEVSPESVLNLSDARLSRCYDRWLERIRSYQEIDISVDESDGVLWCYMAPKDRPSVTPLMAQESLDLQSSVRTLHSEFDGVQEWPFRYMIWGSRVPGVFNLGGDLRLFAKLIREGDRASLTEYARNCTKVVHENYVSLDLPMVTVSLVEGDALGGGFEAAVSGDVVLAERSAKFGLPEVLFNLFPGMGAYSIIARRTDAKTAERLILSGRVYTAEDLYEMGLVDLVVDDGQAHETLFDYIQQNRGRFRSHLSVYRAGRMVNPLACQELMDVAEMWVDTALALSESDLRRMERLAAAQDRRRNLTKSDG